MKSFPRAIAHLDADCFFASVELVKNPKLRGKPVGVCTRTDNRGIVNAANYEARALGVRAGTPVFRAKQLCPNIILVPGHFRDYEYYSHEIFNIVRNFSPDVEVTSIDEAYIDLTGLRLLYRTSYEGIALNIQETVYEKLKLPVSLGIASTKLLAKLASDKAKPMGILAVPEQTRESFLKNIPIGDICGVGPNTDAYLRKFDITNALQLCRQSKAYIESLLGKRGVDLWFELNGISISRVSNGERESPKSLSNTSTFPNFSNDRAYIYAYSLELLHHALFRLRHYSLHAKRFLYFLTLKNFQTHQKEVILPEAESENRPFFMCLKRTFNELYQEGGLYRKTGIVLTCLISEENAQKTLFSTQKTQKSLGKALDLLGENKVFPATFLVKFRDSGRNES